MLPRRHVFHVQGWLVAPSPVRRIQLLGPSRQKVPLGLRTRPDVAKTFPEAPFTSGFFGVAEPAHLRGESLRLRFDLEGQTIDRDFHIAKESQAAVELRIRKLLRVYPALVCIACGSGFGEDGLGAGAVQLTCPKCKKVYDCSKGHYDFLPDEQRAALVPTADGNISATHYDEAAVAFIEEDDGLLLDCGAGLRPVEYPHVINLEVVPYRSTDVLAVNERLPFADASFDGVLSLAVLEHVKNPFVSAREICRVLRPGGRLLVIAPLLAPVHAYPDHYFNMTAGGLVNLFSPEIEVLDTRIPTSGLPIWALTWILRSWAEGLPPEARASFLNQRVGDLVGDGAEYLGRDFVKELPRDKNFELASTTLLLGRRRG